MAQKLLAYQNTTGSVTSDVQRICLFRTYHHPFATKLILKQVYGSLTFFNEAQDDSEDYTGHLALINPAITILSVGADNPHGHPDGKALTHYENHCYGAENGQKVFRTDQHGNIKVELHGQGTGWVYWNLV